MNPDLGTLMDAVVAEERATFDFEHPADDAVLYSRVISPLRRARRLAPVAVLGVLLALAVPGLALIGLAGSDATTTTAPAAPSVAASPAGSAAVGDPEAVAGEAGWTVAGLVINPRGAAAPLADSVGPVVEEPVACGALEAFGRLVGRADGTAPVHLGAFVSSGGGANDVHVRSFATAGIAAEYVGELWRIARRCADEMGGWGVAMTVARVDAAGLPGDGVAVAIPVPFTEDAWRLQVYVDGASAIAVVSDPTAADRALSITRDWAAGGLR
ncbi:hypothetical protein QQX13_10045 [Demequina sp. SYSU T00068]|uniref:hypothetical protein n=1 Tax=Demequina lignilytica TaxID=3051663 RepID=UPI002611774E|nr:hypothetical protein [Demequina sp. SYSU T00068]MDN4491173.1 hypothetical protein [Demequina sp. SYSU T00068]